MSCLVAPEEFDFREDDLPDDPLAAIAKWGTVLRQLILNYELIQLKI